MSRSFDYRVFGLGIRSEIALPELFPDEAGSEPDVTIRIGAVPQGEPKPSLGAFVLSIPEVGRYRVEKGREIVVDPNGEVPARNLRLFLLGSAFGALLHQRGMLPLHANAVDLQGRAVAFMGPSGAGKSTLAAWFHDQGHRIIADDVCVAGFDADNLPFAAPGLPRLRLWAEALERIGRVDHEYARSYVGEDQVDKFDVPIQASNAAIQNVPLFALYMLDRGDDFSITRMTGVNAADAVFANTYRGGFVSEVGGAENHWRSVMRLVQNIPVFRVMRAWSLRDFDDQAGRMLDHARNLRDHSKAERAIQ